MAAATSADTSRPGQPTDMNPSRQAQRGKAGGGITAPLPRAPAPGARARGGPSPGSRHLRRDAVVIFLGLWLVYGATIDRTDVYDYALQQFVIASLVSKGTYAIGEAGDERFKRITDTFVYEGKRLPAKQPGQFTIGALAYLACSPFGIAYSRDRILASALVTWLTSSLLSALSAACLFLLMARTWGFARGHSALSAAASGLATILLPYSGVAHHDILAVAFLVMALYLIEKYTDRDMAIFASKFYEIEIDRDSQSPFLIFSGQRDHRDDTVRRTQEFIEGNYNSRITVERLSYMFGVGRRSLERRFKTATGNTVTEYIQRVRIEAAKKSLETRRKTINEVMYDVGYSDTKAFRTVFRKVTGVSPMDYRNRYGKEAAFA